MQHSHAAWASSLRLSWGDAPSKIQMHHDRPKGSRALHPPQPGRHGRGQQVRPGRLWASHEGFAFGRRGLLDADGGGPHDVALAVDLRKVCH